MRRIDTAWWRAAGIRAIKTAAQAFLGAVGATTVVYQVDWKVVVGTTIMAAILSLVTSLAGLPELEEGEDDDCSD